MPSGAILTKAGAIRPNRTATPGVELHQIAPNCTKLRLLRQKIKKEKTRPEERYSAPINGQPAGNYSGRDASPLCGKEVSRRKSSFRGFWKSHSGVQFAGNAG
jgi:hypothetical protein